MSIKIKTWRDPYDYGFTPTKPKEIELNSGLTVLVGCNGAGKTTLLNNIKDELYKEKIPVYKYDNLSEGHDTMGFLLSGYTEIEGDSLGLGALMFSSSEGETIKLNVGRHSSLYKEFLKTGHFKNRRYKFSLLFDEEKEKDVESNIRVFLFDATDSGLSIDSIIEIKTMFDDILADSKKNGLETYIIISANEYELCRNSNCFDVNEGKYITFEDYEDYRKFIINSRAKKEKRIEKQLQWVEKKKVKEEADYKKLKESVESKIAEINALEQKENRELTYKERRTISDLDSKLREFKRACRFADIKD